VSVTPAFAPREIKSLEGAVRLEHLAPDVLATTVTGRGDEVIARAILEASDPIYAAAGRTHAFHDWLGVTGYTSEARTLLTGWSKGRQVEATLLFENRILAMGVSVVGPRPARRALLHRPRGVCGPRHRREAGPQRCLNRGLHQQAAGARRRAAAGISDACVRIRARSARIVLMIQTLGGTPSV